MARLDRGGDRYGIRVRCVGRGNREQDRGGTVVEGPHAMKTRAKERSFAHLQRAGSDVGDKTRSLRSGARCGRGWWGQRRPASLSVPPGLAHRRLPSRGTRADRSGDAVLLDVSGKRVAGKGRAGEAGAGRSVSPAVQSGRFDASSFDPKQGRGDPQGAGRACRFEQRRTQPFQSSPV